MSTFLQIHPDNPQPRLIARAADGVRQGGVIAYPTDSCYALGCRLGDQNALARIRRIRRMDKDHNLTLVCRDLKELSAYARVENSVFRLLKHATPGPYTFILPATKDAPKRLMHPKRKTIGLRIPDCRIALDLLAALGEPIMSATLFPPGEERPMTDAQDIRNALGRELDAVIDGGYCGPEPTTIVDLTGDAPIILRHGVGDPGPFE